MILTIYQYLQADLTPKYKRMEANKIKTVKVVIKDVTGENPGLMLELSKAGVSTGTVVEGTLNKVTGAVYFTSGCGDCIAWLHETCEIFKNPNSEKGEKCLLDTRKKCNSCHQCNTDMFNPTLSNY
jgi:hypothetical protein